MPPSVTTGWPSLDLAMGCLVPGDNIVWQIDALAHYQALAVRYAEAARRAGRRLLYFRFASHEPLIPPELAAEIHTPDPRLGFESFVTYVHQVIEGSGRHALYLFDCLSELALVWAADQMLGNFFLLTCPRLRDLETVAYFGIYRNYHASFALNPITQTTQFLLDVFAHHGDVYVRPIKVQHRFARPLNTLHVWQGDEFRPITNSAVVAEVLSSSGWPGLRADTRLGFWRRIFNEAQQTHDDARAGRCPAAREQEVFERLSSMVLSRDESMLRLVSRYLSLADVLEIRDRMVGIGLLGGKTLGMLLARAILKQHRPRLHSLLETHDSFYIGSDVFYTFLIRNGIWWLRQKQRDAATFLDSLEESQTRILQGQFPDYTVDQFQAILDYFGESPYVVRSSSLLEDAYGNAFAGKYDSVFCVNQGTREERLRALLDGVRRVYASAMSEQALRYRVARGLLDRDEQMALLVMRVSGNKYGDKFLPAIGGVGFSFNPYVWHKDIDPHTGVLRIVFGLGTRAVDRADDDYTRLVALNAPLRRPESSFDEVCEYSQRRVDYLDFATNRPASGHFLDLARETPDLPLDMIASRDRAAWDGQERANYVLTFEGLLSNTPFVDDMRDMLAALEEAYAHPVDVEFTVNFLADGQYRINLLQCRPLQVQGTGSVRLPHVEIRSDDRIVELHGPVIGPSRLSGVDRFLYVAPRLYAQLPLARRYAVARLLGAINPSVRREQETLVVLGPGRWGTSSPELGIPVQFSEISHASAVCEIVAMRENLVPDVSLGTHFFNELVEMNTLYMALFPSRPGNYLNEDFFLQAPNRLVEAVPSAAPWQDLVRLIDTRDVSADGRAVLLLADAGRQEAHIFFGDPHLLADSRGLPS